MNHEDYIRQCYSLAISAGKQGYDTFGALLVHDGKVIASAGNTADYQRGIFGHAEFNLVHQCANQYPDSLFNEAVFYTSCAPCERCLMAIASLGVRTVVYGVSYKEFSKLTPFDDVPLDREGILAQLNVPMKLIGPVLEDEGMHVFEYWGGEYRPLAELIAEMDEMKLQNKRSQVMKIDYVDLFHHVHPGFFEKDYIKSLPVNETFAEQIMPLADFDPQAADIPAPAHITYGMFTGDIAALQESVREVDEDWVQYFRKGDRVYCAFDGEKVVSFCLLDDFGEYQGLKIGAPGCVGTVPAYRKQGIGLKMVQKATAILKEDGYDLSYIHYTAVGHWYARLGYETIIRWNCHGIC